MCIMLVYDCYNRRMGEKPDASGLYQLGSCDYRIFQKSMRIISFSSDHKSYESTGSDLIKIFISEHAAVKVSSVRESWDMSFV